MPDSRKNPGARSPVLVAYDLFLAMFLAFSVSAETLMDYTGDIRSLYPENFVGAPSPASFALFGMLAAGLFALLRLIRRHASRSSRAGAAHGRRAGAGEGGTWAHMRSHRAAFLLMWAAIALAWILLLLQFWPGTCMNDQLSIIKQPIVSGGTHPLLYNLALSLCVRAALALTGSGNAGFAAFILLQIVTCSGVVAFCCQWLRHRRVPVPAVILVAAFFALEPLVASFSVNAWKDTLFGYAMLLWLPFIWEAADDPEAFWSRGGSYALLAALVAVTAFLRNNGLLIALATAAVLLVWHRPVIRPRMGALALGIALCAALAPSAALSAVGVHQLFREVVNIPLQQLAAVQEQDDVKLPAGKRAYLDALLPQDDVRATYMPLFADGIKFTGWFDPDYTLDRTKGEFLRVYLDACLRYPDVTARAYLSHTYGNWSLLASTGEQAFEPALSANIPTGEYARLMEEFGLHNASFYPQAVQSWFDNAFPRLLAFPGPGACFALVLLIGFALSARFRSATPLAAILPLVLLWTTLMLATPLSLALRYVFPMVVAIPFLAALLASPLRR